MNTEIIHTEPRRVSWSGKSVDAELTIEISPELDRPDFDYGNNAENDAEMARFESGELLNLCVVVRVSALDESGMDSLGQCFVRSAHILADVLEIVNGNDMALIACEELIEVIQAKAQLFKEYI